MKTNNMWRMLYVDYEGSQAQCLTCKQTFAADSDKIYKYCPCCGIELKTEFTKKNPRWYGMRFKRHFPVIECWCLVDKHIELDGFSFLIRKKTKITQEWEKRGSVYLGFNGFQFRKDLLNRINTNSKCVDSPTKMKLVIKTWDGHERTIFGSQLKSIFNRQYQKIDPPKPYTFACSGSLPEYYNSPLLRDVLLTIIKGD